MQIRDYKRLVCLVLCKTTWIPSTLVPPLNVSDEVIPLAFGRLKREVKKLALVTAFPFRVMLAA